VVYVGDGDLAPHGNINAADLLIAQRIALPAGTHPASLAFQAL
jgi:hypothetical protein